MIGCGEIRLGVPYLLPPDHNAVHNDILLHLLLFISRSSGTLWSVICPMPLSVLGNVSPLVAWLYALSFISFSGVSGDAVAPVGSLLPMGAQREGWRAGAGR